MGSTAKRPDRRGHAGWAGGLSGLLALLLFLMPGTPPVHVRAPDGDGHGAPRPEGRASLSLRVTDAEGEPIAGARVQVRPDGAKGLAQARTDAKGRATVPRLPDGGAEVRVAHAGHARSVVQTTVGDGGPPLRVQLGPGGSVAGLVVDPGGDPVAGARVTASVRPEQPPWETTTADKGRFRFDTLPPAQVSLAIRADGFDVAHRRVDAGADPPRLRIVLERVARVAGQVYRDDGGPAEGTTVVLAGSGVWPPRRQTTGEDGRFRFDGLPGGVYEVQARQGNRVAPPREGLMLEPGAEVFLALRLEAGAGLAGRITDAATGEPIAEAEVTLTEQSLGLAPRTARTNADGRFSLGGLRRRAHQLSVQAEGYVPRVGETVEPGADGPVELSLRPGAVLAGVVVDALDHPVAGARLEVVGEDEQGHTVTLSGAAVGLRASLATSQELPVEPSGAGGLGVTTGPLPPIPAAAPGDAADGHAGDAHAGEAPPQAPDAAATATGFVTDDEGHFRLEGVPPGRIQLLARHDAHAPGLTEPRIVTAGAEVRDLRVVMPEAGSIAGRVVDTRGFPVAGVPVEMRVEREPAPSFAVSESDGTFRLEGARGAVVLTALPDGQPAARTRVDVGGGEEVEVELALDRARVTLEGRTVDRRGFPVAGAQVRVRSLDASTPVQRTAFSRDDGTFTVDGLPLPPYRIEASHSGYATTRLERVTRVDERVKLRLQPGAAIGGRVLDDWNDEPIAEAEVSLRPVDDAAVEPARTRRTDSSGDFEFSLVPAGDYEVIIEHTDYLSETLGVSHAPGPRGLEARTLDPARLRAGGSIEGEVVDALGGAVSGAEVAVGNPPRWEEAARTDPAGRFELSGVPDGEAVVTARHPAAGQARAPGPVGVRTKERTPGVRIRLPERFDASGADAGEGVRSGVAVRVRGAGDGVRVRWVAPGSGAAAAGLRPGDVLVAIDDVEPRSAADARDLLRGPTGVEAALDVRRGGRERRLLVPRERWVD